MTTKLRPVAWLASAALVVSSCGGGGSSGGTATPSPSPTPSVSGVFAVPAQEALTTADVQRIIAQAAEEAAARSLPASIAVVDRVGNVLAVFNMTGARPLAKLRPNKSGTNTDLEGVDVPAAAAAIAKAITGAYLSSGGNAFSTRTASQIVQEHFPPAPAAVGLESGPLFGVQLSQLPCSDLSARFNAAGGAGAFIGPKRSPLGLSADAGGFPLYKNGVMVGGIGVMADGDYGFDTNILDVDDDAEEVIATAGTVGFEAPTEIRADRVTVDGTTLRYTDTSTAALRSNPANARAFATIAATLGALTPVNGYSAGVIVPGTAYGTEASGIRKSTDYTNPDIFVLSDGSGANRYPPRAGTDGANALTAAEVRTVLEQAFIIMSRARGQIRRPLDSRAQVSLTVVDTNGEILGLVRGPDAPIFGIDVSLQKARTAMFFSSSFAGPELTQATRNPVLAGGTVADPNVRDFVARTRAFLNDANALTGRNAITARAVGNLARPYFPDGEVGRPNGPLSRPIQNWSPLSTGLQTALVLENLAQHVVFASGGAVPDTPPRCTFLPSSTPGGARIRNGIQIFPGAVPIYRGATLIGAIGISGDGIDQDDMIAFLGTNNAGALGASIRNADPSIRSDQIVIDTMPGTVRLRYVGCPFAPFLDTTDQNACQGK